VLGHLPGVNDLSVLLNYQSGVNVSVLDLLAGVKFAGTESLIDRSVGL
jgi:hypothetical protein